MSGRAVHETLTLKVVDTGINSVEAVDSGFVGIG
jgi:hypothetical protein